MILRLICMLFEFFKDCFFAIIFIEHYVKINFFEYLESLDKVPVKIRFLSKIWLSFLKKFWSLPKALLAIKDWNILSTVRNLESNLPKIYYGTPKIYAKDLPTSVDAKQVVQRVNYKTNPGKISKGISKHFPVGYFCRVP